MTGLLDIEIFVVINDQEVPSLSEVWVQYLLSLQLATDTKRTLDIRIHTWKGTMGGYPVNQNMVQNPRRFKYDLRMELAERKEGQKLEA